jgi:hypothetical protein
MGRDDCGISGDHNEKRYTLPDSYRGFAFLYDVLCNDHLLRDGIIAISLNETNHEYFQIK